jgi:spermidine/putrescine transport system permease protein
MKTNRSPFRFTAITLVSGWLVLFLLVPNLFVLGASLLTRSETRLVSGPLTMANYTRLLDPAYGYVLGHSAFLSLVTTFVCLLLGYPVAWAIARTRPGLRHIMLILLVVPYWTNSLVRTYAIRTFLATKGVLNAFLLKLGIISEPLKMLYTGEAVTVGLVYLLLPFMVLPLYAVLEKMDPAVLEAAEDLGAGTIQKFFRVLLPLSLPGIIAGSLLVFLPSLGMFYVADLLGGSRDLLVGNLIKNQFLEVRNWPFGSAASIALIVIMVLLLVAYTASIRWTQGRAR